MKLSALLLAAGASAGLAHKLNLKPPPLVDDGLAARALPEPHRPRAPPVRGATSVWDRQGSLTAAAGAGAGAAALSGEATFTQLLDHADPSQGTFSQRYWYNAEYWTGPGAPVGFFTPGESAADQYTGYLTNRTITGQFAQAVGGAVVMLEHRYWGQSAPFDSLTTKNLRFLTLANSIADTTYFARNVVLPFAAGSANASTANASLSNAPHAPWIMSGGSYSGALTAWVEHVAPGTFWAYHASSAVVEAVGDFWQYFEPVRAGLPANCSADVQRVVAHVDDVLSNGSDAEIQALKDKFGLGSIEHADDFASALENGPWTWQEHDFDSGYSAVYQFCDYVENAVGAVSSSGTAKNGTRSPCRPGNGTAPAAGVGLAKALDGYARWTSDVMLPGYCAGLNAGFVGERNTACFDTHNASSLLFTDTRVDNAIDRQWYWLLCNEPFEFWQTAAPAGRPTLVSRRADYDYMQRQCALYFPEEDGYTFGSASAAVTPDTVNAYTGGWSVTNTTRLVWVNGEFDPWRDATVSADSRPGGPLASTDAAPVHLIPGGIHCSDLIYANALANDGVMAVVQAEIATIKRWVDEFYQ